MSSRETNHKKRKTQPVELSFGEEATGVIESKHDLPYPTDIVEACAAVLKMQKSKPDNAIAKERNSQDKKNKSRIMKYLQAQEVKAKKQKSLDGIHREIKYDGWSFSIATNEAKANSVTKDYVANYLNAHMEQVSKASNIDHWREIAEDMFAEDNRGYKKPSKKLTFAPIVVDGAPPPSVDLFGAKRAGVTRRGEEEEEEEDVDLDE